MDTRFLGILLAAAAFVPVSGFAQGEIETPQARESYRIKARQDLDRVNERLSALELEARVEQKRAREDLQARAGELRARKKEADELFGRIETGTDEQRREARARLDAALRDLWNGIERAEGAHRDWGS
jgi:hypothetical protein